jgi:glycosyl transferase, family 25
MGPTIFSYCRAAPKRPESGGAWYYFFLPPLPAGRFPPSRQSFLPPKSQNHIIFTRMNAAFDFLNTHYDCIYVLTLQRAKERQQKISQSLSGLRFQFWYGKDKANFTVDELAKAGIYDEAAAKKIHRYHKPMTAGQIGCSWSHRCIYEDVLAKGYERVLIFEDDALPNTEALHLVQEITAELPATAELLFWGYGNQYPPGSFSRFKQFTYHLQHSLGLLKWNHRMINHLYPRPFSKNLFCAGFHDYTYAYALTQAGAQKLLRLQTPIQYIADNLLAWACTNQWVEGYITRQKIFLHDEWPDGTPRDSFIQE